MIKSKRQKRDAPRYMMTSKELIIYSSVGTGIVAVVSILFYDSFIAFLIMLPMVYPFIRFKEGELYKKRKQTIELEFREIIMSVSANLQAGYSVENAFKEAYGDLVMLYGQESIMAKELFLLMQKLQNNQPLEEILMDMANRCDVDDIRDFAEIFQISKRSGGDIRGVIANTANILGDKIEVRREIRTIMSEKDFEQKIMKCIPFVMILYVSLTTSGFFDSLYHNIPGILIMTACLIVYGTACLITAKIMDIEI